MVRSQKWFSRSLYLMAVVGLAIVVKVTYLQYGDWYGAENVSLSDQVHVSEVIVPKRGSLVDRFGYPLAQSVKRWDLFVDPVFLRLHVDDLNAVASFLHETCQLDQGKTREQLEKNKRFIVLKKDLSQQEVDLIKQINYPGLKTFKNQKRVYPEGYRTAHLIGYVERASSKGLEGLELFHEDRLKGSGGKVVNRLNVRRALVEPPQENIKVNHGENVRLTIDVEIQRIVDRALDDAFAKWQPQYALALVMDPHSGGIYALSVKPGFNPSKIYPEDLNHVVNRAVCHCWEPGSILKPMIWAAALEENVVSLDDQFYCEPQGWRLPGRVLHDAHPYGWLSVKDILVKSSNVGMAKIAQKLIKRDGRRHDSHMWKWLKAFGFGDKTGIDLPGEIAGIVHPVEKWTKTSWASIPMGHEIAVTPIQYLRAFNVFASGGYLVSPHVMYGETDHRRRVLSEQTADVTAQALFDVVQSGTGRLAKSASYEICGKTGTAQKIVAKMERGKKIFEYSHEKYVSSFAAFAPLVNPKLTVLVVLDEPHQEGVERPYGGIVCAPVAAQILEKSLNYLEIRQPIYQFTPKQ